MKPKAGLILEKYKLDNTPCKHYWLIEPANGPVSRGKCKICSAEQLFDNVLADLLAPKDISEPFESDNLETDTDNLEIIAS